MCIGTFFSLLHAYSANLLVYNTHLGADPGGLTVLKHHPQLPKVNYLFDCISEDFGSFYMSLPFVVTLVNCPAPRMLLSTARHEKVRFFSRRELERKEGMSAHSSPEWGNGDSEQAQSVLLKKILDNQDAIQGLSERLMPLLLGNLQRLADSNDHTPQVTEADGQVPRDLHSCHGDPAAQHVALRAISGESDARMRVSKKLGQRSTCV